MSRKTFFVQVELDIQAVTCPGVWLCANGNVSLQIYVLESCVQTACRKPCFPIQFNQKFLFYKTYSMNNHRLNALNKALNHEYIYIEFIQWRSCETGTVLATFQTTLNELLYPTTKSGSIPGIDIDLLMEPTKCFPGKIAPIIQLITKTAIDEKICVCESSNLNTINPKIQSSQCGDKSIKHHQPRKVCHSIGYSRRKFPLKTIKKPPFRYRKPDEYLILRKPQYDSTIPNHQQQQQHRCRAGHIGNVVKVTNYQNNCCAICSTYHGYFKLPLSNNRKCKIDDDMFTNQKCCDCRPLQRNDIAKRICNDEIDDDDDNEEKLSNLSEQLHKKLNDALETLTEPDCQCSNREELE